MGNLFQKHDYLKSQFELEEYYIYLQDAIKFELSRGSDYLNPAILSKVSEIDYKTSLSFLVSIGSIEDNRIINIKYIYECMNCGEVISLDEDKLSEVVCINCNETINAKHQIELEIIDLEVCFEIDEQLRQLIKQGFNLPSSDPITYSGIIKEEGSELEKSVIITDSSLNSDVIVPEGSIFSKFIDIDNRKKQLLNNFKKLR